MLRLRCRIKIKHEGEILVSIVKDSAFSFNNQFRIYKQFRINKIVLNHRKQNHSKS